MKHISLFLLLATALVSKAQNVGIGTTIPNFPLTVSANAPGTASVTGATVFATNTYSGSFNSCAIHGESGATTSGTATDGTTGIVGVATATNGGYYSAGVRGINLSTSPAGMGVIGYHAGSGYAVYGETPDGTGVAGGSNTGLGGSFTSFSGVGLSAISAGTQAAITANNINTGSSAGTIYAKSGSTVGGTTTVGASAIVGELTATSGGYYSAGVRGINRSTSIYGVGVIGYHAGGGYGVYGEAASGTGLYGYSTSGNGVYGFSASNAGGNFNSNTGNGLIAAAAGTVPTISASNSNTGNASGTIYGSSASTYTSGGATTGGSGVVGEITSTGAGYFSAGIRGINRSTTTSGMGVVGYQAGNGIGVYGETPSGQGVTGYSASGQGGNFSANSGTALYTSSVSGNAISANSSGTVSVISATNTNGSNNSGTIYASSASTVNSSVTGGANAILGVLTPTSGINFSAAVRGVNYSNTSAGVGVVGYQAGNGIGVYGETPTGQGVTGYCAAGQGGNFGANSGTALYAGSISGIAVSATNNGTASVISATNTNAGNNSGIIYASSASTASSSATAGANAIIGVLTPTTGANFSAAVRGVNYSTTSSGMGVVGYQGGAGMGVYGEASSGSGVNGYSTTGVGGNFTSNSGAGIIANAQTSGNAAIFQGGSANVARIDRTGKGFFNGGTQNSGADVAEAFAVEGNRNDYQPGDVLVVSKVSDRTVAKSNSPYSTLVVGVYATKPGVLLTERMEAETQSDLVPMGVVGVIPTKVCSENGPIHRGDMIVTSSVPGRAMKATQAQIQFGTVIGKALEDFTAEGNGLIKVLVNVK